MMPGALGLIVPSESERREYQLMPEMIHPSATLLDGETEKLGQPLPSHQPSVTISTASGHAVEYPQLKSPEHQKKPFSQTLSSVMTHLLPDSWTNRHNASKHLVADKSINTAEVHKPHQKHIKTFSSTKVVPLHDRQNSDTVVINSRSLPQSMTLERNTYSSRCSHDSFHQ
jgi:hypothetical protein